MSFPNLFKRGKIGPMDVPDRSAKFRQVLISTLAIRNRLAGLVMAHAHVPWDPHVGRERILQAQRLQYPRGVRGHCNTRTHITQRRRLFRQRDP